MALEALLPSEVARLVYGYLIDEKCMKTAKLFLNESPNLEECRAVLSYGRHFTTRVCGYALLDILEKFCLLSSILQEKVEKFDNLDKLKHCGDIIGQIKILLEEYKCKGQQNAHTNISSQDPPINLNESPRKFHKRNYLVKDDIKLKSSANIYNEEYKSQIQINQNQVSRNRELEATPLKNLPGYTNNSETKNSEAHKIKSPKKSRVVLKTDSILRNDVVNSNFNLQKVQKEGDSSPKQRINGLNQDIFIPTIETNLEKYKNAEVQTSELVLDNVLDKVVITDAEKQLKSYKSTEVQTSDIGSPCSEPSPADECIELLGDVTVQMINRIEIHEKIAENINKIWDPIKSNFEEKPFEGTKEQSNKSFLLEFDKAVQLALNKTENDPDFFNILNENFLPSEEVSSTEDEGDVYSSISDDNLQKEINVHSECKTSNNNPEVITVSSENNKDIFEVMQVENNNEASSTKHMENENVIDPVMAKQNDTAKNPDASVNSKVVEVNVPKEQFKVPMSHKRNSENSKTLLNTLESPILQQKSEHKIDNFLNQNNTLTSTPLKTCLAIQNFDTCDWFPTQDLVTSNVICQKEGIYNACETTSATPLSPIILLDTSTVSEKPTTISYLTMNALKDQTLHTPEIIIPSRNGPLMNLVPKNKTPSNTQVSQKSNDNSENLSQLLKDNEYNKYFNVDSLMLYGIDNNIGTIPAAMTVPEIEVEDSLTFTGTGLSPFIKVLKKADEPDVINKQTEKEVIPIVSNVQALKPSNKIDENNGEIKITSITKVSDIFTKNTPKALLEDRSKNNRLSLSTPKKPNHHVRAIDFDAATNKSQSEGKLKISDDLDHESIMKNLKDSCKSSLFQSPPFTNSELIDQKTTSNITQHLSSGNTDPANIENSNTNKSKDNEKAKTYPISEKDLEKKDSNSKTGEVKKIITERKSWDSDLRKYLSQVEVRPLKRKYTAKSKEIDQSKKSRKSESTSKKVKKSHNKSSPRKWKKSKKSGRDKEKKDSIEEKKKDESKENEDRIEEKEKDDGKNPRKSSSKKSKKSNKSKDSDRDRKKGEKSSSERVSSSKSEKKKESKNSKSEKKKEPKNSEPKIDKSRDSDKEKKKSEIKSINQETSKHTLSNKLEKDKESEILKAPKHEKTEETKVKSENSENRDEKAVRDSLEEMLSNSINDIANEDDVVKLASEEMHNLSKLRKNETVISYSDKQESEILVKMQQDEESMSVVFETIACDLKIKYFPENNSKPQASTVVPQPDIVPATKPTIDCDSLEKQLSQLISPASDPKSSPQDVIYDRVNKVECGRVVEKKYARLKTLDRNIKYKRTPKYSPFKGFTPRKADGTLRRPQTPLVLSPSSSASLLAPPALSKLSEDSGTMPGLVAHTPPDCPSTPTIVLTPPKTVEEKKRIDNQRETTSYYHPVPITFEISKKSEITQFDVIKENLPKDAKTKSHSNTENVNEDVAIQSKLMSYRDQEAVSNNESNDSSSDSSSSASTCGECSCEECSHSTILSSSEVNSTGASRQSVQIEQVAKVENIIKTEGEVSPTKVFKINKTDKEIAEIIQETPAKDENAEVDIFDTPSVSKPITENPTNLNAKISEMMVRKEREELERQQNKLKPAIASVKRVLPKAVGKPISQLMKALPLNIQMTAMEVKKENDRSAILQRIKMKNSNEEVAKAVESITALECEKLNATLEKSITPSPMDKNEQQNPLTKAELVRAIQSIANTDRSRNASTSSGSQVLELVLEETEEDDDGEHHLQEQQQRQQTPHRQWGDYECIERSPVEHVEVVGRKKRRKKFSSAELQCSILSGGIYHSLVPTDFDILLEDKSKKKRIVTTKVTTTKRKKKTVICHDEESRDSVDSSTDNCSNDKQSIFTDNQKRPLPEHQEIVKNKKPKTNMYIL